MQEIGQMGKIWQFLENYAKKMMKKCKKIHFHSRYAKFVK